MEIPPLQAKIDPSGTESIWIELNEKLPSNEKFIDVQYLDGSTDCNISPHSVELMEVEFWRESKPNPIQVDKVKACFTPDFIPNLPPDYYRLGEPCDLPGCGSDLSHPCEGCGRYAAGLQSGPDTQTAIRYIQNLKVDSELIHRALSIAFRDSWSWEQVLTFIVIEQDKLIKVMGRSLNDAIINRPK